jgi:hypothetical protein
MPVPFDRTIPITPMVKTEDNSRCGDQPHSASVNSSRGRRSASDTGSGDRVDLETEPETVREVSGESGEAQEPGEGDSVELRPGPAAVPEQGDESGSGPGADTGLDNSPALRDDPSCQEEVAKIVALNRDWCAHPDNW